MIEAELGTYQEESKFGQDVKGRQFGAGERKSQEKLSVRSGNSNRSNTSDKQSKVR